MNEIHSRFDENTYVWSHVLLVAKMSKINLAPWFFLFYFVKVQFWQEWFKVKLLQFPSSCIRRLQASIANDSGSSWQRSITHKMEACSASIFSLQCRSYLSEARTLTQTEDTSPLYTTKWIPELLFSPWPAYHYHPRHRLHPSRIRPQKNTHERIDNMLVHMQ